MKRELASLVRRLRQDREWRRHYSRGHNDRRFDWIGALAVDIGSLAYTQRRLQATADMAALAGAAEIACTSCASGTENTAAGLYSGKTGSKNAQPDLTITMVSGYPQGKCLHNFGAASGIYYNSTTETCTGLDGYNAMEVQEQATVPFLLGSVFGFWSVQADSNVARGR